jgi:hypothetical protein
LGDFSHFGPLIALGSFLEMTKVWLIFGLLFPQFKFGTNFDKTCVGQHFGRLFKDSSGHPGPRDPNLIAQLPNWPFVRRKFSLLWHSQQKSRKGD